jgi:hypothetical protein
MVQILRAFIQPAALQAQHAQTQQDLGTKTAAIAFSDHKLKQH